MKLTEFKDEYAKLVHRIYLELNEEQRACVYAMEIYRDSGDALIACDIYAGAREGYRDHVTPEFVDDQLRNTFEYTDVTMIESI